MLGMVSYSRRPKSGQIMCYLNRTYHVLLTAIFVVLTFVSLGDYSCPSLARGGIVKINPSGPALIPEQDKAPYPGTLIAPIGESTSWVRYGLVLRLRKSVLR